MSDVEQAFAELDDLVRCRCHPAYKDRGLHDPDCNCDYADTISTIRAALSDERAHADAMAEAVNAMDGFAVEIRDDRGRFYSVRAKDYERLDNLTRAHRARRQG